LRLLRGARDDPERVAATHRRNRPPSRPRRTSASRPAVSSELSDELACCFQVLPRLPFRSEIRRLRSSVLRNSRLLWKWRG
jgi:hypothetical protein